MLWILENLPNDQLSIENAIIMKNSDRWPLCIDPQCQARAWIKHVEQRNQLKVIRFGTSFFARSIENAIQFGQPILIENIGESIDPILDPILENKKCKINGIDMIKF